MIPMPTNICIMNIEMAGASKERHFEKQTGRADWGHGIRQFQEMTDI